jgi:hypothetical protein
MTDHRSCQVTGLLGHGPHKKKVNCHAHHTWGERNMLNRKGTSLQLCRWHTAQGAGIATETRSRWSGLNGGCGEGEVHSG